MVDTAVADAVVEVKVTLVPIEQIDDNPYNPRQSYVQDEIEAMGDSLITFGLREVATGRRKDGRVQLAFGHKRLRGFRRNEKTVSEKKRDQWKVFPLIIKDLTDTQMFDYALVENLQRSDVKPIEIARALAKFTEDNPTVKDKEIAKKHGMSEANISNMRRVLRLPQKFLDMINEGVISFTQGRELLTLEKKACADQLMGESIAYVLDGSFPNTVEGLQGAIKKTLDKYFSTEEKKRPENKPDTGTNISQEKPVEGVPPEGVRIEKEKANDTPPVKVRTCRVCGCTDEKGCLVEGDTSKNEDIMSVCSWVEENLCSACDDKAKEAPVVVVAAPKVRPLRKMVIQEGKDDRVTVSITLDMMEEEPVSIEGAFVNIEGVLSQLPELLIRAAAFWKKKESKK